MKSLVSGLFLLICAVVQAQYDQPSTSVKIGAGYAHDFPGLNGYSTFAEVSRPISDRFKGAFGVKMNNMSGYPRTATVHEYTKSTTLDFSLYFVPLATEWSEVRIGAGYSFSFYNTRRSYPVITRHATGITTDWPVQDKKGRTSGATVTAEYEYLLTDNFSLGARASYFKAYDGVTFAGVFGAVRF